MQGTRREADGGVGGLSKQGPRARNSAIYTRYGQDVPPQCLAGDDARGLRAYNWWAFDAANNNMPTARHLRPLPWGARNWPKHYCAGRSILLFPQVITLPVSPPSPFFLLLSIAFFTLFDRWSTAGSGDDELTPLK